MKTLLSSIERQQLKTILPEWEAIPGRDAIYKKFVFDNFEQAFAWMTKVAQQAEDLNHHPEWFNVWNTVEVTLSTHESQGLTQADIDLALAMEKLRHETESMAN